MSYPFGEARPAADSIAFGQQAANGEEACPYARLSYLIVEDSPTMKSWLRSAIADAGGKRIDMTESYGDALYRIRTRGDYDVVLCDYLLSDTRDGQQLLEEVRRARLLPQATIWLMITGERAYEQVFSAAELAPDDYLLKPITPAILHERLGRAWDRKQALKEPSDLFDAGRYAEALEKCQAAVAAKSRHALAFMRLMGDCLMQLEHYREAYAHYEAILAERPTLPWAKLGKARAFFHLDRHDESQEILDELIKDNPDFLHAHDLKAKVHERKGDLDATKALLRTVLQKNPKALHRHREVVRVAMATDDAECAIEAYALMHLHGKGSSFLAPGDFCAYAAMLMKSDTNAARSRLDSLTCNLRDFHRDNPAFGFSERMVKYAAARHAGNDAEAKAAYAEMMQVRGTLAREGQQLDSEQGLAMLEAAIGVGDEATAVELASGLFVDYVGNESMSRRIDRLMAAGGLRDKSAGLAAAASERLKEMNKAAVDLAKRGMMLAAIEEFSRLAESNRNIAVYLNAATAIVKYFEDAVDKRFAVDELDRKRLTNRLESYLNFVRDRDPGNLRMEKIEAAWQALRESGALAT